MQTVTRKIEISILEEDEQLRKEKYKTLYYWLDSAYKIANMAVNSEFQKSNLIDTLLSVDKDFNKSKIAIEKSMEVETDKGKLALLKKEKVELSKSKKKEIVDWFNSKYGCNPDNIPFRFVANNTKEIPAIIYNAIQNVVVQKLRKDFWEVKTGQKTLQTFKKGMPIYFTGANKMIPVECKSQYLDKKGKRHIQKTYAFNLNKYIAFKFNFGRDKSNNRVFVQKWMTGEYKFCDSSLQYDSNKKKWYLLGVFKIPSNTYKPVKNRTMGVDIGVNSAAYCGLPYLMVGKAIGDGKKLIQDKQRLYYKKRELQKSLRMAKGGRGRKRKLVALNKHQSKERNFTRTANHKIAKDVVDFAVKHNVETIVLEELKHINKDNAYLQRWWSYFELQTLIEQKVKQHKGMKLIKVNPAYTSQTCCYCGNVDKANRPKGDGQRSWEVFDCTNNDCESHSKKKKLNADFVAAINIAKRKKGVDYKTKIEKDKKGKVGIKTVKVSKELTLFDIVDAA